MVLVYTIVKANKKIQHATVGYRISTVRTITMYRLFKEHPFRGRSVSPEFNQARVKQQRVIDKAIAYYRENNVWVNNSHPIIKLLDGFSISMDETPSSIYRRVEAKSDDISAGVGITTTRNVGEIHDDAFYCKHCLLVEAKFSTSMGMDAWRTTAPIKPLTHTWTTLEPMLPTEAVKGEGYAVVAIDLPLLAVRYYLWMEARIKNELGTSPQLFFATDILPEMLVPQADICVRNMFVSRVRGGIFYEPGTTLPFFTTTPDALILDGIDRVISDLRTGERTFSEITETIPSLSKNAIYDVVPTSIRSISMASYWVTFLVYLDWSHALFVIGGDSFDATQELIPKTVRGVKRYVRSSRPLKRYDGFEDEVTAKWETVKELSGN